MNDLNSKTRALALSFLCLAALLAPRPAQAQSVEPTEKTDDLDVTDARVEHREDLDLLVFEQTVAGTAGATTPDANGALDGAPVLGYVFPTTLAPEDVGFHSTEGILALAATAHPDFDDTPLWDEDGDGSYDDDGRVYHTHWVVLEEDSRVAGGLAVKEVAEDETGEALPPTSPAMPMYLDSPGFSVVRQGNTLKVLVPAQRVGGRTDFQYDAVTAYMEVNTSDEDRPMLGVYEVYDVLSGDLSLPYGVGQE